jgi:hypothetical protein
MEAIFSSETLVDTQRTTRHYIPEDGIFHNYRCENLKSYRRKICPFWMNSPSRAIKLSMYSAGLFNCQHMAHQLATCHHTLICISKTRDNTCVTLQTRTQASQFMKFCNRYKYFIVCLTNQNNQSTIHFSFIFNSVHFQYTT